MSGIFVPELAELGIQKKFPAIFEQAVTRFGYLELPKNTEKAIKKALRQDDVISSIANREEVIWALWSKLCDENRV